MRLAVVCAWCAALLFATNGAIQAALGATAIARTSALMALVFAGLPLALRATGSRALAAHSLPLLLWLYALGLAAASGGKAEGALFAAAAVPMAAVLLGGVRAGLVWSALACAALLGTAWLDALAVELPPEAGLSLRGPDRFRAALLFTLGTSALVIGYEVLLQRARTELSLEQARVSAVRRQRRESEQRFRVLTEEASDVVTEWDAEGFIHYVSPQVERLTGMRPEELLHTHWLEHVTRVHPEDTERFNEALERVVQGRVEGGVSMRLRHNDGSWRWLEFGMRSFRNAEGEVRVVSIGRDVTDRREIEALRGRTAPG